MVRTDLEFVQISDKLHWNWQKCEASFLFLVIFVILLQFILDWFDKEEIVWEIHPSFPDMEDWSMTEIHHPPAQDNVPDLDHAGCACASWRTESWIHPTISTVLLWLHCPPRRTVLQSTRQSVSVWCLPDMSGSWRQSHWWQEQEVDQDGLSYNISPGPDDPGLSWCLQDVLQTHYKLSLHHLLSHFFFAQLERKSILMKALTRYT